MYAPLLLKGRLLVGLYRAGYWGCYVHGNVWISSQLTDGLMQHSDIPGQLV